MAPLNTKAYLSTQVNTANRVDLVVALYEKAIACVANAMESIEDGDSERRSKSIHHAADIVMGLCDALDYSQEGDIAVQLFTSYNMQLQLLLEANRSENLEHLQTVKSMLSIMVDGWRQVATSDEARAIHDLDAQHAARSQRATSARPSMAMAMTA